MAPGSKVMRQPGETRWKRHPNWCQDEETGKRPEAALNRRAPHQA